MSLIIETYGRTISDIETFFGCEGILQGRICFKSKQRSLNLLSCDMLSVKRIQEKDMDIKENTFKQDELVKALETASTPTEAIKVEIKYE